MTIAVTAVSGKLGGAIARTLIAKLGSGRVIGLARTPEKVRGLDIEVRPGDYNDVERLKTSLEGVQTVLLVSGMDEPTKRIQQHRNVIDAARAAGAKRLVYTSIQGLDNGTAFSPVVSSNRQTEADVRASGLEWTIGRNGIYIEPDVEFIENYKAAGEIANCDDDGLCGYTTRNELGHAYAALLTDRNHNGQTYDLHGELMTQTQLAAYLNSAFDTALTYRAMSVDAYRNERIAALGPFLGGVIAGIYEGIALGAFRVDGDFERVAGRPHRPWDDYFRALRPRVY